MCAKPTIVSSLVNGHGFYSLLLYFHGHAPLFDENCSNFVGREFDECRVDARLCKLRDTPAALFRSSDVILSFKMFVTPVICMFPELTSTTATTTTTTTTTTNNNNNHRTVEHGCQFPDLGFQQLVPFVRSPRVCPKHATTPLPRMFCGAQLKRLRPSKPCLIRPECSGALLGPSCSGGRHVHLGVRVISPGQA